MFTWKRFAITLLFLALGFVGLELVHAPEIAAQTIRPALVRSIDEPARVPFFVSAQPTCPFLNECSVNGGAVPVGKRLRVTRLEGMFVSQVPTLTVYLSVTGDNLPLVMFPSNAFNQAFFGTGVSFNQEVDFYFEAGQTPFLVVATPAGVGGISTDSRNRLTMAGYLVDVQP
jgi:hypothetical protein